MEIFKYLDKGQTADCALEIYDMVFSSQYRGRASSVYKNKVDPADALDDAFFQVYTRYSPTKGRVENFANATMSTIDKSKHEREVPSTEAIEQKMDKAQLGDTGLVGVLPDIRKSNYEILVDPVVLSTEVEDCIPEIEEYYIHNLEYLTTGDAQVARAMPDKILLEYEWDTIVASIATIYKRYQKSIDSFLKFMLETEIRPVNPKILDKNMPRDITLDMESTVGEISVLQRKQGYHAKNLYRIDLERLKVLLWKTFYETEQACIITKLNSYYLTLSGKIVSDKEELMRYLEAELVYAIICNTKYKVADYEKGHHLILSTTKTAPQKPEVNVFGKKLKVDLAKQASKEVVRMESPYANAHIV